KWLRSAPARPAEMASFGAGEARLGASGANGAEPGRTFLGFWLRSARRPADGLGSLAAPGSGSLGAMRRGPVGLLRRGREARAVGRFAKEPRDTIAIRPRSVLGQW